MSERKPKIGDMPAWVSNESQVLIWTDDDYRRHHDNHGWTYWKPAAIPEPPKKELTQRERDEEMLTRLYGPQNGQTVVQVAWHAALAYRDQQNAEDLSLLPNIGVAITNLRRRCGLET